MFIIRRHPAFSDPIGCFPHLRRPDKAENLSWRLSVVRTQRGPQRPRRCRVFGSGWIFCMLKQTRANTSPPPWRVSTHWLTICVLLEPLLLPLFQSESQRIRRFFNDLWIHNCWVCHVLSLWGCNLFKKDFSFSPRWFLCHLFPF